MPELFGMSLTRHQLSQHVGDLRQVAGVRLAELADGPERGMRVADVTTGSGFAFTVLLDRGMDIGAATYNGRPLAWQAQPCERAWAFHDALAKGLAGLARQLREGIIRIQDLRGRRVVAVCTGHGLKDPEIIAHRMPAPLRLPARMDALEEAILGAPR